VIVRDIEDHMPAKQSDLPFLLSLLAMALFVLFGPRREAAMQRVRSGRRPAPSQQGRPFGEARSSDEPRATQHARTFEAGRGRDATSPARIPWRGWVDIARRTYSEIFADRLLSIAGGIVFFVLLAIFPAITALVSAYGLFSDPAAIGNYLSLMQDVVPPNVLDIVRAQVARIASHSNGTLSIGVIVGLLVALWSAMSGVKAILDALNVIYDQNEGRGFFRLNLVALAFTLCGFASFLLAIAAVVVLPLVLSFIGFGGATATLMRVLRWPALFLVLLGGLAALYRFGPHRRAARWRWVSVGSVFAALTWVGASYLFSYFLSHFANYEATYGSLGAAVGLMMWLWISGIVVLVGAEINAEVEHQTAKDSTVGGDKPLGERGATMADTVGASQS
jgi:membrane protein